MGTPESDPRAGLRAFAAHLVMVGDGLFFGALFFTFCFPRSSAYACRTPGHHIQRTPVPLTLFFVLVAARCATRATPAPSAVHPRPGGNDLADDAK